MRIEWDAGGNGVVEERWDEVVKDRGYWRRGVGGGGNCFKL